MTAADAGPLHRTAGRSARAGQDDPARAAWPDEPLATFVARTWAGCAAVGTGLVLVGLGPEHVGHHVGAAAVLLASATASPAVAVAALHGSRRLLRPGAAVLALADGAAVAVGLATQRLGPAGLVAVGALAVAAATGNGLAATEAGDHAVPHGVHVQHGHG